MRRRNSKRNSRRRSSMVLIVMTNFLPWVLIFHFDCNDYAVFMCFLILILFVVNWIALLSSRRTSIFVPRTTDIPCGSWRGAGGSVCLSRPHKAVNLSVNQTERTSYQSAVNHRSGNCKNEWRRRFPLPTVCFVRISILEPVRLCFCVCYLASEWIVTNLKHWGVSFFEDVPLVDFTYLEFTRIPGESYRRRLGSLLLYLFDVFRALINSLLYWFFYFCLFVCLFVCVCVRVCARRVCVCVCVCVCV